MLQRARNDRPKEVHEAHQVPKRERRQLQLQKPQLLKRRQQLKMARMRLQLVALVLQVVVLGLEANSPTSEQLPKRTQQ